MMGYRAVAAKLADEYGVAPLPVLEKDRGRRIYDQEVKHAEQYTESVLLSLIDVTIPSITTWCWNHTVEQITAENVTAIECFNDPRIDDPDEYIIKLVTHDDSGTRTAFYEGAGLDVAKVYCNLFGRRLAIVCWDETRFSPSFNQILQDVALFDETDGNRAEEVRTILNETLPQEDATDVIPMTPFEDSGSGGEHGKRSL